MAQQRKRRTGTDTPAKQDKEVQLSEKRTDLAAQRTRDALERTLMSWIRTSLSMITYGFGLFKVLQYMMTSENGEDHAHPASDVLTMALIGMGTVLLMAAMWQYRTATRALQREHDVSQRIHLPLLGATGVALVGLFALMNLVLTVL